MGDDKFKNLYESFVGQIDYCNLIESYGEDFVDFTNTNFDLLQAQFCGFYLTLLLDEYLIKIDDNNHTTAFIPEFIKEVVKMVAVDNGNGYTLGDLSYHDEVSVLVKIRNKLAHGDFIIRDNEIVFEENKVEGRVNLELLIKALYSFEDSYEDYFLSGPRCKVFNSNTLENNSIAIDTEKDFNRVCNNLYRIEITDTPVIGTVRDVNYTCAMRELYGEITKFINKNRTDIIPHHINICKDWFKQKGIMINCSIQKLNTTEQYKNIKAKYMANFDVYKLLPPVQQLNLINNISYRINKGKFQKFNIRKGILVNLYLLKKFKENPNDILKKVIEENPNMYKYFLYHMDDVIISSYLVGFNSLYEYGLDKESTKNGSSNFIELYDGEQLDFSRLNIDKLYDPNMTIEHNCDTFEDDVLKYENDSIANIDRTIAAKEKILNNYLEKCKNQEEAKINQLTSEIEKAKQEKKGLLARIEDIKLALITCDKDKYTKNLNIIYHIRNAIAHGNIFVDSYSNDIQETSIIIRDFYDGKTCYERKMKIKDFATLFLKCNIDVLYDFITRNINDKSILLDDYLDTLDSRYLLRSYNNFKEYK